MTRDKVFDVYVAIPYTHPSLAMKKYRFEVANLYTAWLFRQGVWAFSPIGHSHPLGPYDVGTGWSDWEAFDLHLIDNCKEVHVLMLPGWRESHGVQDEVKYAMAEGVPVRYITVEQLDELAKDHDEAQKQRT